MKWEAAEKDTGTESEDSIKSKGSTAITNLSYGAVLLFHSSLKINVQHRGGQIKVGFVLPFIIGHRHIDVYGFTRNL